MTEFYKKTVRKILFTYKAGKIKLVKWILFTIFRKLLYLISVPSALAIVLIRPIFKIRLVGLQSARIGHYVPNTEFMLCALDLNPHSQKTKTIFYNMSKPCNTHLYKMWGRVIPIFKFYLLAMQVDFILSKMLGKKYSEDEIKSVYESCEKGAIDKHGFLKKIEKPHLFFTSKEKECAKNLMDKMGIPPNAKFICLIVRDSAYLNREYPKNDWAYHDHRNADIMNYKKSALYLAEKGYYVLRMGKHVEKEFNTGHSKIIDYANHPLRSDFLDLYFPAHCEFCISTTTGLDWLSQIFRKPVLLTNISPVFAETLMWYPCTVFIPKMLKNKNTNRPLKFSETAEIIKSISKPILSELDKRNLKIVENTEDQLLEAVKEMEARTLGMWNESINDELLQNEYWKNHKKHAPVFVDDIYIKMGSHFLKENDVYLQ